MEAVDLGEQLLVPNGDDAAAWQVEAGHASVITTDTLVEGVHFDLAYTPPILVGRKLIAVNLSDLAAMGALPRYALISVCISGETPVDVVERIARGVRDAAREFGVAIIGGNTTTIHGPIVLSAVLIGCAEVDRLITRRGARVGDAIYVTGHVGDAHAGLQLVTTRGVPSPRDPAFPLFEALAAPSPRVSAGLALSRAGLVRAMCDISDGLGKDVQRLVIPEGLGARIEADRLPISPALRSYAGREGLSAETLALKGGEDYELLFAADPEDEKAIAEACAREGTPVTRIGVVTGMPVIEVRMPDGSIAAAPAGFEHF